MALTQGQKALASDMVALKKRVKDEMNRRKYRNSLVSYGGTDYDYSTSPASGGKIMAEHINKIVIPLNKIKSTGLTDNNQGTIIKALNIIDANLTTYETETQTGSSSCTDGVCSGLCSGCIGTCSGSCGGCGGCGGCSGCSGCGGACSSNCDGCSGSCTGSCDGCRGCGPCTGCLGSCTGCGQNCGGCGHSCVGTCATSCYNTCRGGSK